MSLTLRPPTAAPGVRIEYDAPADAQLVVGLKYRVYVDTPDNGSLSNGGRIRADGIHNALNAPMTLGDHLLAIQTQTKPGAVWRTQVLKPFKVVKPIAITAGPTVSKVTSKGATISWSTT